MVMYIKSINDNSGSLSLLIGGLEYPEEDYDGFKIWTEREIIDIPVTGTKSFETNVAVFTDVNMPLIRASGQVCYNGRWINVPETAFVMQKITEKPPSIKSKRKGGAILNHKKQELLNRVVTIPYE